MIATSFKIVAFLDKGKFINKNIVIDELLEWEKKLNISGSILHRVKTTGRYWHKVNNERYLFTYAYVNF